MTTPTTPSTAATTSEVAEAAKAAADLAALLPVDHPLARLGRMQLELAARIDLDIKKEVQHDQHH